MVQFVTIRPGCRARWLGAVAILVSLAAVGGFAQQRDEVNSETIAVNGAAASEDKVDAQAVATIIVRLTNEFREAEGHGAVEPNEQLRNAAQYFAAYMAEHDKYGHTADGKRPSERARDHGYELCIVSENIAYQYRSTGFQDDELAQAFVEGWKDSPEHRENMLDPDVRETGVAVARSSKSGHYYAVQKFGLPQSAAIRFQISNRTGQTVRYTLGNRDFVLEPRFTRTHEQCRPPELVFHGTEDTDEKQSVIQPRGGDALAVVENAEGNIELQRQESSP